MQYAKRIISVVSMAAVFGLSQSVLAADAPAKVVDGILVNTAGMTLYVFDKDPADTGKSVCNGPCAALWPAVTAADVKAGGGYSVITRDDGAKQLAYKGKPLYLWVKDSKPGDKTGDGVNGVWHVVKE